MVMVQASDFIGLSKKRAQDFAELKSIIFRLISVDGEPFLSYPDETDQRTDRICVEIEAMKVTKAVMQ